MYCFKVLIRGMKGKAGITFADTAHEAAAKFPGAYRVRNAHNGETTFIKGGS